MKVNLKRDWFDPSATLREKAKNPHDLPDDWEKILPPGAEVLEEVVATEAISKEEAEKRNKASKSINL